MKLVANLRELAAHFASGFVEGLDRTEDPLMTAAAGARREATVPRGHAVDLSVCTLELRTG